MTLRRDIQELARLDNEHTELDAKIDALLQQRDEVRQRMASLGGRFE